MAVGGASDSTRPSNWSGQRFGLLRVQAASKRLLIFPRARVAAVGRLELGAIDRQWFNPAKARARKIELIDKIIDHPHWVVLIDPPTSSNTIMQRAEPLLRREQ